MCILCAQRAPTDPTAPYDSHLAASTASAAAPRAFNDRFWQGFGARYESGDAANNSTTTASIAVGQSFYGSISNTSDGDWIAVTLQAGQSYEFRMMGIGESFLGDPQMYLYNSAGSQLATNDDGSMPGTASEHYRDSRIYFSPTTTGTYYIQADAYSTYTGDYLLTASPRDPGGMVFTADEIAWQLINNGEAFFGSPEGAAFNVGSDGALTVNITGLTAAGQYLARQALLAWTNVTGITFSFTSGAAEITFDDSDTGAYAESTYSGTTITSSTVYVGVDWLAEFGNTLDSYSFETYIHEIGHALGLGHGGNYNGSATYGEDNAYLNDSVAWSIMSYMNAEHDEFDGGFAGDWNTYTDASFRYMVTPQIADIIAIQYLYGTHTTAFTGNTTYGYNANTGNVALDTIVNEGELASFTVYDSAGIDTLDFSNYSGSQVISLLGESMSSVWGGRHNVAIARGVVIENARGGQGQDTIYGNNAANAIWGNNGSDNLYGGDGNDTIAGGAGADYIYGGNGSRDRVSYLDATSGVRADLFSPSQNTGFAAGDSYSGIEDLAGSNYSDSLLGNAGANMILGGSGNDNLNGREGSDSLYGGSGNDVLYGGSGGDYLDGGDGTRDRAQYTDATAGLRADLQSPNTNTGFAAGDTYIRIEDLSGTHFSDRLFGNSGANRIWGGSGNDELQGRAGADTLYGGSGNDVLYGGASADVLDGGAGSRDRAQYTDSTAGLRADLQSPGANTGFAAGDVYLGIEDLAGTNHSDLLFGSGGGNMIWGGSGNDSIAGRGGADTIYGGDGNDQIYGNEGNDVLYGGTGADFFLFNAALGTGNVDRLADFNSAADTIRLDDAIFGAIAAGTLSTAAFTIGSSSSSSLTRIVYNQGTGQIYYDANGTAGGGVMLFATVAAGTSISASDFYIY